jgi:hypothetical protein
MAIEIEERELRGYLKEEYIFLQGQYEDYDKRTLGIKGWVATGAIAGLVLAFNAPQQYATFVTAIVAVITTSVWGLEATWKVFQQGFADRIRIIEAYFRDDPGLLEKSPAPFQIFNWWFLSIKHDPPVFECEIKKRPRNVILRFAKQAFHPFVFIPYLPILFLCAIQYHCLTS